MRTRLLSLLLLAVPAVTAAQPGGLIPPPRPHLFLLDLQGTALDEFPDAVKALIGVMTVVDKNGQHMLKASSPSEFLITLPQALPADFTIELDFIPKAGGAPDDITLEGTPTMNRGIASAQLTWQSQRISAVGGSADMYQSAMPDDLAASTPNNLTSLVVVFQGPQIKLYTNGRRLYTLDKQFARGRVLRVGLGGADDGLNAVYLASFRIMDGAMSPSTIAGGPPPGVAGPGTGGIRLPGGSVGPVAGPGGAGSNPTPCQPTAANNNCTSYVPPAPAGHSASPAGGNQVVPPPPTAGPTVSTGSPNVPPPPTGGATTGTSTLVPPPPGAGATQSTSQALTGATPVAMMMAPKVTQGAAGPVLQWTAINNVTGYTVKRWKIDDLSCCNNASAAQQAVSPWQDAALVLTGTYVYQVEASLVGGATAVEQTQFTVMTLVSSSTPTLPVTSVPISTPSTTAPTTVTAVPVSPMTTATGSLSSPTTATVAPTSIAVQSGTPISTVSAPPPGSPASKALTPTGPPPSGISITGTPSLAQLNWSSGISGMRGVTYKVERWLESNPSCCMAQSSSLTFPAWTDEGLQWSGAYVFRITEFYADGTWGQASQRYVRPDPVNPTNFRAVLVSAGSVYLRWDAVPNAAWYELSGPGLGLATFNATGTSYNVHNLAPGTYTWKIGTFYSSPNAPGPVSGPASAFPTLTVTVP